MDPITFGMAQGAAGAGADPLYVDDVFSNYNWSGDNSSSRDIVNGIDLSGEGGLVWLKARNASESPNLFDTSRGAQKAIFSSSNAAEGDYNNRLTAFNNNGFRVNGDDSTNKTGTNYTSWTFREEPGFFDIVTYTGTGSAQNIAHSLGSTPGMILIKCTSHTSDWSVYHRSLGATKNCHLNDNSVADTQTNYFNDTEPTSTQFTVGSDGDVNGNSKTYVAYVFAHDDQSYGENSDESIIKCGTYTGSSGQEINIGFEPQFFLTKCTTRGGSGYDWTIIDAMRYQAISPSQSSQDFGQIRTEFRPGGVQFNSVDSDINESGETYVYMAIRRPNKPFATAGTDVYYALSRTGTNSAVSLTGFGFTPDMVMSRRTDSGETGEVWDRIRGRRYKFETATNAAVDDNAGLTVDLTSFDQDGISLGSQGYSQINYSGRTNIIWSFKRAAGFFDMFSFTGNASVRTLNHQLGVVPELVIIKGANTSGWTTYHKSGGRTNWTGLHDTYGFYTSSAGQIWGNTDFTSTQISVGTFSNSNANNVSMMCYMFATLDGISKVGSYTGTGNNIDIDCGFTSGARWIMIKRSDGEISSGYTSGWYVWDSVRGIVTGNDPWVRLDDTSNQDTSTDYIDPLNAGFTVTSNCPPALNENGGDYIFLAIA